ncbi:acetylglutamate kinase [Evansella tamaricis]|uniref:Acetylglutamate kinase n=1 Tax=Evansella tamaricis TaxID=2069301 RepID=A0ABS6JK56_9BACI|nr:acetylglutamate kinase [Evansella tamaricis]MBU9714028.1 acetylglutamate kinase [Evansella tamaricis]
MNYLVIKCGGSVLDNLPVSFYKDLVKLQESGGWKPVIVHGGGPLITSSLKKLGVETAFVDGLRVTTEEVLNVVEMVLSGAVNKQIVGKISQAGGRAFGLSGVDGDLLQANALADKSLGYVGEVVNVNTNWIDHILDQGFIPVVSPLGMDKSGQKYNINGDVAASAIAKALNAKLCFVSDIAGIYIEEYGNTRILTELKQSDAIQYIQEKKITGGMIPKVLAAIDGLTHHVQEVVILNGMEPNRLIDYISGKAVGTKLIRDGEIHYA